MSNKKLKIAFCFLSIDDLFFPTLWNQYFENVNPEKCEIIIHTKNQVFGKVRKAMYFTNAVKNEWQNLLGLHIFLLKIASEIDCDKVIYCSDNSLPLLPFDVLYQYCLDLGNKTVLAYDDTPYLIYDHRQPQNELKGFLTHGHNWIIIDKRHYDTILYYHDLEYYQTLMCSDEHFFPTLFKGLGIIETEAINEITTYVNWERPYPTHPYIFKELTDEIKEEIINAKKEGYFFIRKIDKHADPELIVEILKNVL